MKKFILSLALAVFAFEISAANAITNLLSLTYVNGTNNGSVYYASNIVVPMQRFTIQSLGITNGGYAGDYTTNGITNAITINLQYSVDSSNSNWVTLATYKPNTTNALVEISSQVIGQIAIPMRMQVVTTNALGVAIFTSN